jgi:hypothetical protein
MPARTRDSVVTSANMIAMIRISLRGMYRYMPTMIAPEKSACPEGNELSRG